MFSIVINNCPNSLKLIVQFYRIFGFTFSGVQFSKEPEGESKDDNTIDRRTLLKSIFLIAYQMLPIAMSSYSISLGLFPPHDNLTTNITNVLEYEMKMGIRQYHREFDDFKPILRTILQCLAHIFMFETLINYLVNLFTGGRLIAQMSAMNNNAFLFDRDNWMAYKILATLIAMIVGLSALSFAMFNQKQINVIIAILFQAENNISPEEMFLVKRIASILVFHTFNYFIQSMVTILFGYTMFMFKRNIEMMQSSVKTIDLTESELCKLNEQVVTLRDQFHAILRYFSLPLTLINATNIYLIISSACFLMVTQGKPKFFSGFIFTYGIFSMVRLIVVCCSGNLASTAYQELVREVYERVAEWNLGSWMCFIELKQMRDKFRTTIFSTYSISQSAILSMLGFALNYIVVLLQTENYGTSNESKVHLNNSVH